MDLSTIEEDVKEKPWLLILPVGVVAFLFVKSRANATTVANSAPGTLAQAGSTTVGPDYVANAIQQAMTQQQSDVQNINTEIAGINQQNADAAQQTQAAVAQQSQQYSQQIAAIQQQIASNVNQAQQSTNLSNGYQSALDARSRIGENAIVHYFTQFSLPSWVGLWYVAENWRLPTSKEELLNWLNRVGMASGQNFTLSNDPNAPTCFAVNCANVPVKVQATLNNAYGTH